MRPHTIDFSVDDLSDLRKRLARTRFRQNLPDEDWRWGVPQPWLRDLVDHWLNDYDWQATQAELNALPQVIGTAGGLHVHAFHVRSPHPEATPLLLCHGWPGSIVEFLDCLPALTDPTAHGGRAEDAFHVVLPSMPGFGLSGPTSAPGAGVAAIATAFADLMRRLGYERFVAQGGDWGAFVVRDLGLAHADRLLGAHINFPWAVPPPGVEDPLAEATPQERAVMEDNERVHGADQGYSIQQETRPHSIGPALEDSPAGLAAWLLEKFHTWADTREGLPYGVDRLLDNTMLYWLTGTATSAARLYAESVPYGADPRVWGRRVEVPTGVAVYPYEKTRAPRAWLERQWNLVHWSEQPRGGHFAAFEQPELFVGDLRSFARALPHRS
ncbi:pimeloyl-ACP methyl ester carboxylesterase [Nocardiopsis sp. Huas11]|uniref:epoxide hydrolase family protein n=1 Tax=Nocardiopsis sp. Huas11 TaxID=2183912 RepID=UPI000EB35C65|nr:epoxide hydrolase family protein [Nocardiopsis sp. Huas11]RKS08953.1 pimeloyl-ACP methyl ester carboxylesterase [Nocardiopsis sp. Huas11]